MARGETVWRGLEDLETPAGGCRPAPGDPVKGRGRDEFKRGAAEPPVLLQRRTMLGLVGASAALAGLSSCRRPVEKIVPLSDAPEDLLPGVPRWYATSMPLGNTAYGLLAETHEGRPTKIEGNDKHPSSMGGAGSWMQASILDLYDPDRSPAVLKTVNGAAVRSSWEEFADFWRTLAGRMESKDGEGLAVLSGESSSPTWAAQARALKERFPRARWVVHDPVNDSAVFDGIRLATGTALRPQYHLKTARVVVALDSDLLLTETDFLRHAHDFAAGRRLRRPRDPMNRLYAVESSLSVTGAAADERIPLKRCLVPAFLERLARILVQHGLDLDLPAGGDPAGLSAEARAGLERIASDLKAAQGEALIVAGRFQPAAVHALVLAINEALVGRGKTYTLHDLKDVSWGHTEDLAGLARDLREGSVTTLVVVDNNPVYASPPDLGLKDLLMAVPHLIHLGSHRDETGRLAEWHLPQSHFMESWEMSGQPMAPPASSSLSSGRSTRAAAP
ncbi:MAG: hypothetical protein ACE5ID_04100 [Acidobacteriota bacterium]